MNFVGGPAGLDGIRFAKDSQLHNVVRLGEVRLWVRWHAAAGIRWATVKRENGDQEERQ